MDQRLLYLDWIGRFLSLIFIAGLFWGFYAWARGILPAILRLGNGLAKRKIAIFAKADHFNSLESLLCDSGLFKQRNIFEISTVKDLGKAEEASVYLVYWKDWTTNIDKILAVKSDKCALVIYAPFEEGRIPDAKMRALDGKRHSAVTNFRGRLLNDIVTAMITTGYEKR